MILLCIAGAVLYGVMASAMAITLKSDFEDDGDTNTWAMSSLWPVALILFLMFTMCALITMTTKHTVKWTKKFLSWRNRK